MEFLYGVAFTLLMESVGLILATEILRRKIHKQLFANPGQFKEQGGNRK